MSPEKFPFEVLNIVIILYFKCETSVNLTEKFAAGAWWWRRRWKYLSTILLWKIISRISKALTGVDIFVVSCISWAVHVWGWGEGCMMVTVSGERSCKSAELGLQQKTNSGFHKVKTLQRHKNDLVSQNCPCLSLWSRSREPFKYCFVDFSTQKFRQTFFLERGGGVPSNHAKINPPKQVSFVQKHYF